MTYTITKNLIPGLPTIQYDNGKPVGVVAHATAVYNDSPTSERNVTLSNWASAFAHIFVGRGTILQIADINYVAYAAGRMANHLGYIHVELCQTYDTAQFQQDYAMYVWILAKLLRDAKLPVIDGETLMSHKQVSNKWKQTDHVDPIDYLASHGVSWSKLVEDVRREYNLGGNEVLEIAILKHTDEDEWSAKDIDKKLGGVANFTKQGPTLVIPNDAMTAKKLFVIGGGSTGHPNEILLSGNTKYDTNAAVGKWLATH